MTMDGVGLAGSEVAERRSLVLVCSPPADLVSGEIQAVYPSVLVEALLSAPGPAMSVSAQAGKSKGTSPPARLGDERHLPRS